MKKFWSTAKHVMWYLSAAATPFYMIGGFANVVIPQLCKGFENPWMLIGWVVRAYGLIAWPWLLGAAWRLVVRNPDESYECPMSLGGRIYRGPSGGILILALALFALAFQSFPAQMLDAFEVVFEISVCVVALCAVPLLCMSLLSPWGTGEDDSNDDADDDASHGRHSDTL